MGGPAVMTEPRRPCAKIFSARTLTEVLLTSHPSRHSVRCQRKRATPMGSRVCTDGIRVQWSCYPSVLAAANPPTQSLQLAHPIVGSPRRGRSRPGEGRPTNHDARFSRPYLAHDARVGYGGASFPTV